MSFLKNFYFFFPPLESFFLDLESFSGKSVFLGVGKNDINCQASPYNNKTRQCQKRPKTEKQKKYFKNGGEKDEGYKL